MCSVDRLGVGWCSLDEVERGSGGSEDVCALNSLDRLYPEHVHNVYKHKIQITLTHTMYMYIIIHTSFVFMGLDTYIVQCYCKKVLKYFHTCSCARLLIL